MREFPHFAQSFLRTITRDLITFLCLCCHSIQHWTKSCAGRIYKEAIPKLQFYLRIILVFIAKQAKKLWRRLRKRKTNKKHPFTRSADINNRQQKASETPPHQASTWLSTLRHKPWTPVRRFASPFLFVLRTRLSPPWDRNPRPDTYWGTWMALDQNNNPILEGHRPICFPWRQRVCLVPSTRFHMESLLIVSAITLIPLAIYTPLKYQFPAIILGLLPLLAWTTLVFFIERGEVLSSVWSHTPPHYRDWVDTIIHTRESKSPVSWSTGSADEALLRMALVDTFSNTSGNATNNWSLQKILTYFSAPLYLSLCGLGSQSIGFVYTEGGIPPALAKSLNIALLSWGIISYFYFRLQSRRIVNYLSEVEHEQVIPGTKQLFQPMAPDLKTRLIQFGIPAAIAVMSSIGLAFINNLIISGTPLG